jgi:hypothetical protein
MTFSMGGVLAATLSKYPISSRASPVLMDKGLVSVARLLNRH